MSAFNPAYNPVGYPTDAYGRPILENSYAPFYPGPFADQYVLHHWPPDPNQAFYTPSISQGIPPGWRCPPAFHANGNNLHINPRGYSAAPPNPAYLPPTHYYAAKDRSLRPATRRSPPLPPPVPRRIHKAYPHPPHQPRLPRRLRNSGGNFPENTQGTLGINDNLQNELRALVEEIHTSLNLRPFEDPLNPARSFHVQREEPIGTQNKAPSSVPRQQEELNVASSILRNLNPAGGLFNQPATHTLTLSARPRASLVPSAFQTWDQPAAPKLRSQQLPLRVDNNNRTLSYIDEPGNPADEHPPRNGPQQDRPPHFDLRTPRSNASPPRPNAPAPPQQPMGPGAPQPPLSVNPSCPPPTPMPNPPTDVNYFGPLNPGGPPPPRWAPGPAPGNVGQNPSGGPPNGGPPGGWGLAMDSFPPQRGNGNNYYYYYNARPPPRTQNSQDNTHNALAWEGKLNIQKPKPFTGCDPRKWRIFLTQCLTMFQAKPITFQLESSRVAFATSYLQGIAFDHYTALLRFDPNNPVLSHWLAFTQEFSSKFGVFDTVAEAEENLFNLQMRNNKRFMTFIIRFK
ncbi:hypothetical protein C0989_006583 [Termitomyces sp. Mn162]|nr:hypothetical protein C0989_006583 [Termitomyces sp. Mn162]